jgi:hypothetical protein
MVHGNKGCFRLRFDLFDLVVRGRTKRKPPSQSSIQAKSDGTVHEYIAGGASPEN